MPGKTLRKVFKAAFILSLGISIIGWLNACNSWHREGNKEADSLIASYDPPRLYGINLDSFTRETYTIKRNQFLGTILQQYGVPWPVISQVIDSASNLFDIRKIKAGNNYTLFYTLDSLPSLRYIVYEHNSKEYLLINLTDSVRVRWETKPTRMVTRKAHGKVNSSLWNTMHEQQLPPLLAVNMSEIYAWCIDFFGLQPGDSFRVVYDEIYVDTTLADLGKIHAACFYHAGKAFYAIPFVQDERETYFDETGNSLRRAFLKAPLRYSHIGSRYSNSRFHPILKIRRPHHGVDYSAPYGTPVYSIGDGRILSMQYDGENGRIVRIRHNSVYSTAYLHLSRFATGLQAGNYIKQGDVIGYVGSSGLSTGPHLDFRFYKNGSAVDPLKVEAPPVEPVKPELLFRFDSVRVASMQELGSF
jgi:murein DD-endopeptidase MepM/ murein hydrolase activator NlpD